MKDIIKRLEDLISANETGDLANIRVEDPEPESKGYDTKRFQKQKALRDDLLNPFDQKTQDEKVELGEEDAEELTEYSDVVAIKGWILKENISSRLIDVVDDIVILECLIDREKSIYEEREFPKSLFTGYNLDVGNFFYLRIFERTNELRIEVHNDPNLMLESDFPKLDFVDLYRKSSLSKSK